MESRISRAATKIICGVKASYKKLLLGDEQRGTIPLPVKTGTGISLAACCNIGMPGNTGNRIGLLQCSGEGYQRRILNVGKRRSVAALKFYANREIVTACLALPAGCSRMPGTLFARNKLDDL